MKATQESVVTLRNEKGELKAIVIHDMASRHQVHYNIEEMGADELVALYENSKPAVA